MLTRRHFLKATAATGAALAVPWYWNAPAAFAAGSPSLTKYLDRLLIPPVLDFRTGGTLTLTVAESTTYSFHTQLGPARTWGYGGAPYLGPTILAQRGNPLSVDWVNTLPDNHFLPVDFTLDWANPLNLPATTAPGTPTGPIPVIPHLHGGFTPPQFDGHPLAWFTPNFQYTGSHFEPPPFTYSNAQPGTTLWYHDHAMGITRLNVYAGLAGFYLLRDQYDTGVPGMGLNLPKGDYEIPLVIQDKMFNADGTLFYPNVGVTTTHPVWVPEFFGDTPVVNGKAYPYLEVEPRRYRFRFLNGSDARFYHLWFDNGAPVPCYQIGAEGGLLPAPVQVTKLLLAPAERADIIFDFTGLAGQTLTLKNNAKAPFPGGGAGRIPNLMQFRVTKPLRGTDTTTPAAQLVLPPFTPLNAANATTVRNIVLVEQEGPNGNPLAVQLNGKGFEDPVMETPQVGATEVWQFINITGDAHPMHVHLVQFQIVNRQPFDVEGYTTAFEIWLDNGGTGAVPDVAPFLTGTATAPDPNETGFKDTAKAYPGQVLRIVARFDVPPSTLLPAEYVYHCHILEHEDNEMMRPYQVMP
jgi:spore coat protein A